MSPVLSAVLLDAADLGEGAHGKGEMHDADDGTQAIRGATQAITAPSGNLDLESSTKESSPPSLNNAASNSLLRGGLSPNVATENQPDIGVTELAHDSRPIQATAVIGEESSQGETFNDLIGLQIASLSPQKALLILNGP
jgi:hypothetical protein